MRFFTLYLDRPGFLNSAIDDGGNEAAETGDQEADLIAARGADQVNEASGERDADETGQRHRDAAAAEITAPHLIRHEIGHQARPCRKTQLTDKPAQGDQANVDVDRQGRRQQERRKRDQQEDDPADAAARQQHHPLPPCHPIAKPSARQQSDCSRQAAQRAEQPDLAVRRAERDGERMDVVGDERLGDVRHRAIEPQQAAILPAGQIGGVFFDGRAGHKDVQLVTPTLRRTGESGLDGPDQV